jgi:hypothetical protein
MKINVVDEIELFWCSVSYASEGEKSYLLYRRAWREERMNLDIVNMRHQLLVMDE